MSTTVTPPTPGVWVVLQGGRILGTLPAARTRTLLEAAYLIVLLWPDADDFRWSEHGSAVGIELAADAAEDRVLRTYWERQP